MVRLSRIRGRGWLLWAALMLSGSGGFPPVLAEAPALDGLHGVGVPSERWAAALQFRSQQRGSTPDAKAWPRLRFLEGRSEDAVAGALGIEWKQAWLYGWAQWDSRALDREQHGLGEHRLGLGLEWRGMEDIEVWGRYSEPLPDWRSGMSWQRQDAPEAGWPGTFELGLRYRF